MRKRAAKGSRSRTAREARAKREARYARVTVPSPVDPETPIHALSPRDLYHHEKARRAGRHVEDPNHPIAQARRMYQAMVEAAALSGKGGRPKKIVAEKKAALADALDAGDE